MSASIETPQIEYATYDEWDDAKNEAYKIIKKGVDKWILEDAFEYKYMLQDGLTPRQTVHFPDYIEQALLSLTKNENKEWCNKTAWDTVYAVSQSLNAFVKTGVWDIVYSQTNIKSMSELIYTNIIHLLGDEGGLSNGPVSNMVTFTCDD